MTSLPHKRIEEPLWRRQGHRTTLLVESGRTGKGGWIGVPYGSMARLILLYLQTEAVRTGNPEVELGRSMHAWLSRMGISAGGKNYKLVGEQARRISACRLTFLTEIPGAELRQNGAFVQNAITLTSAADQRQRALWQDRVRLDEGFWKSLREHPVPVRPFRDGQVRVGPQPVAPGAQDLARAVEVRQAIAALPGSRAGPRRVRRGGRVHVSPGPSASRLAPR